jgi:hypothetical protein
MVKRWGGIATNDKTAGCWEHSWACNSFGFGFTRGSARGGGGELRRSPAAASAMANTQAMNTSQWFTTINNTVV